MSFSFHVQDSRLVCEGEGLPFLKLKTTLSGFLGSNHLASHGPKAISLPLTSAVAASSIFKDICGEVPGELSVGIEVYATHASARQQAMSGILENKIELSGSPWIETLDPAQAVAVTAMVTPGLLGLCLFDEQGIGKTVTAISAFDILRGRGETDCLVVVCPVTMIGGWKKEIETFLPGKYKIATLEGAIDKKRSAILSPFDILICNFESVPRILVPLKAVLNNKRATLAVDESFNVKNDEAVRSIAVRELRGSCVKGFVMCGTPAPNSSSDIVNQFDIADDGYTFAGFALPKDEEEQSRRISERIDERGAYVRRLKENVLPFLPEKRFTLIPVSMSGRQAALYEEARNKLELTLKGMDNATFRKSLTSYFQQRSALLQICACPEAIDPTFLGNAAKLSALDELVEEIVEKNGRKIIIWSFYRASLAQLFERYKKYGAVLLDGSSDAKERSDAVRRFQTEPGVKVCIANPAAAGAGVTLHSASDAAYVSFSNQAAHFLQSIDRIHRRGQQADKVSYHLIVCRGTIEETEVKRLREKETRQQELLGDRVNWPSSLDEALAELSKSYEQ